MARISNYIIQRVLEASDIVDVVQAFGLSLWKTGANFTCHCPFHEDRHAGNFIVRPKSAKTFANTWHCFVCDEGGDVVKFVMRMENMSFPDAIRWLGKKYNIDVDDRTVDIDIKLYTPPPLPPALKLKRELVRQTMCERAYAQNFIKWLTNLPWSSKQRDRINDVLWQYCVGGWKDGRIVFWQIDKQGTPRAAKLMKYLPDGHRDKKSHPGWIYNQAGLRDEYLPEEHTVLKPGFGLHLLRRYPDAEVQVVESEKTAIFCAIYFGELNKRLWIATAGKSNLNEAFLKPLIASNRVVALHPDRDGISSWRETCKAIDYRFIYVNGFATSVLWKEEDGDKADIADVLIRVLTEENQHQQMHIGDLVKQIIPADKLLKNGK